MGKPEEIDILFTFDGDDFEDLLSEHLEVYEAPPHGFDIEGLDGTLVESEWAESEGILEVYPTDFIVQFVDDEIPEQGNCRIDFIGWQEGYEDVLKATHGLAYHGPANVEVLLKTKWQDENGNNFGQYKVVNVYEG